MSQSVKNILYVVLGMWVLAGLFHLRVTYVDVFHINTLSMPSENFWCSGYSPTGTLCDQVQIGHYDALLMIPFLLLPCYFLWRVHYGRFFHISVKFIALCLALYILGHAFGYIVQNTAMLHSYGLTPEAMFNKGFWCSNETMDCGLGLHYRKVAVIFVIFIVIPVYFVLRIVKGEVRN